MRHTTSISVETSARTPSSRRSERRSGLVAFWKRSRARRRHERSLRRAFASFRAWHPALAESLFDLHLLRGAGAEPLANGDGAALALAWTRQFRYEDERRRAEHIRRVKPVAEAFLAVWAAEIAGRSRL